MGRHEDVAAALETVAVSVDLLGKTLLPGLVDSHCHAVLGGLALKGADAAGRCESLPQLITFAAEALKTGRGMTGGILKISGIPLTFWSKTDELNAHFNFGVYENTPVFLQCGGMHAARSDAL